MNITTDDTKPQAKRSVSTGSKAVAAAVLVAIIGAGGFVGGMQYQKGHTTSLTATSSQTGTMQGGPAGFSGQRNGSFGSVTAVSSSSITVQDQRASTTKTYSITDSTTITNNGSTVSASSITVGEQVMVATGSSTSTTATSIMVNPSMPSGGQMPQQTTSTT